MTPGCLPKVTSALSAKACAGQASALVPLRLVLGAPGRGLCLQVVAAFS